MTIFGFTHVLVWDQMGGVVRVARRATVTITDPSTGAAAPDAPANVTSDETGHVTFESSLATVRLTAPSGYWQDVTSADAVAAAASSAGQIGMTLVETADAGLYTVAPSGPAAYSTYLTKAEASSTYETAADGAGKVDKGSLVVNARDYGATGDGVTDDRGALQTALDAAAGDTLLIPPGDYLINSKLVLPADIRIVGYGATLHRGTSDGTLITNQVNGDVTTTGYNGRGNITIEGLTIDSHGDDVGRANGNIFTLIHAREFTFRDCRFLRPRGHHALDLIGIERITIDACRFEGYSDSGEVWKEAIQLDLAHSTQEGAGAKDGTAARDLLVHGCYFGPFGALPAHQVGVGSHYTEGIYFDRVKVADCTFDGTSKAGVRGYWWRDSHISNVIVKPIGTAYGVQVEGGLRVAVANPVVNAPASAGSCVILTGCTSCTVNGGTTEGGGTQGVSVVSSVSCTVSGVEVLRPAGAGILTDASSDTSINGCTVIGAGYPNGATGAFRASDASGPSMRTSVVGCMARPHGSTTEASAGVSVAATAADTWVFGNDFKGLPAATSGTVDTTNNRI